MSQSLRCLVLVALMLAGSAVASEAPLTRIAFGSCAHQQKPQPIWDAVLAWRPELFVFTGDNVYGDVASAAMTELRAAYAAAGKVAGLARLRAQVPVLATWDDHDYGGNDAGADFPTRRRRSGCSWTIGESAATIRAPGGRASTMRRSSDRRAGGSRSSCSTRAASARRCGRPTSPTPSARRTICRTPIRRRRCSARRSGRGWRSSCASRPSCACWSPRCRSWPSSTASSAGATCRASGSGCST